MGEVYMEVPMERFIEYKRVVEDNARLRKALEFYAKESTYWYTESPSGKLLMGSKINEDLGKRARQALEGSK